MELQPKVELLAVTPDAEILIERACRLCYNSFDKMSPPESTEVLIPKVIKMGHLSVLEHASATFEITGGSRVFTHELVRHRLASYSQESQRYVSYGEGRDYRKNYNYIVPPDIKALGGGLLERYNELIGECLWLYKGLIEAGIHKQNARYILPNATEAPIVITANFREFRHIFSLRCNKRAHWEIRGICNEMLRIMKQVAPIVFQDMEVEDAVQP